MRQPLGALLTTLLFTTPALSGEGGPCVKPSGMSAAVFSGTPTDDDALKIVCLGSSSTKGIGASAPALTYPAQLDRLLEGRLPGRAVEVVNRGVGGETVADNLARLERDVLDLDPDLVIWQVGTNDALRALPPDVVRARLLDGIRRIKAEGVALVLMDPQPLPDAEKERAIAAMSAMIAGVARETGTPLLPRHATMLGWLGAGEVAPADFYAGDRLHMSDQGYRCLAESLADMLAPVAAPR